MNENNRRVLDGLVNYVEKERYQGYDPYDILNSKLPLSFLSKYGQVVLLQLQKRSPISLRPVFGVQKEINPKGMALFLTSYSNLYQLTGDETYRIKAKKIFEWLFANNNTKYDGYAWGYNFVWASKEKVLDKFHPSIVVSGFVGKSVYDYYQITKDDRCIIVLLGIKKYIEKYLHVTENEKGICFSYTDVIKDCCFNASLLAAEILAIVAKITDDREAFAKAKAAVDFVVGYQKEDGRWNYSVDIKTGKEDTQLDFHQGFVIDSIQNFVNHSAETDTRYLLSIQKGLEFYYNFLFLKDGRMVWRYPKVYPIDIHNQAQGIITFGNYISQSSQYLDASALIVAWTCNNMLDKEGYFYHRVNRLYKNKTSFIRWSQAWMMKALSHFSLQKKLCGK